MANLLLKCHRCFNVSRTGFIAFGSFSNKNYEIVVDYNKVAEIELNVNVYRTQDTRAFAHIRLISNTLLLLFIALKRKK